VNYVSCYSPLRHKPKPAAVRQGILFLASDTLPPDTTAFPQDLIGLDTSADLLTTNAGIPMTDMVTISKAIVKAFNEQNPGFVAKPEFIIITFAIYLAHYRTNSERIVEAPDSQYVRYKGYDHLLHFSAALAVLDAYAPVFPNIRRAWAAHYSTPVFSVLRITGGSYSKWPPYVATDPALQFDFAKYLTPPDKSFALLQQIAAISQYVKDHNTVPKGLPIARRLRQ
jgi:hypothetical protein